MSFKRNHCEKLLFSRHIRKNIRIEIQNSAVLVMLVDSSDCKEKYVHSRISFFSLFARPLLMIPKCPLLTDDNIIKIEFFCPNSFCKVKLLRKRCNEYDWNKNKTYSKIKIFLRLRFLPNSLAVWLLQYPKPTSKMSILWAGKHKTSKICFSHTLIEPHVSTKHTNRTIKEISFEPIGTPNHSLTFLSAQLTSTNFSVSYPYGWWM